MVRCGGILLVWCLMFGLSRAETILLDFSSPFCGPCQQLEPTIDRLTSEGFSVRKIDTSVESNQALANRYRVRTIPCLVLLVDGREVDRFIGLTDYGTLRTAFKRHAAKPVGMPAPSLNGGGNITPIASTAPPAAAHANPASFNNKLLSASVRLKVQDNDGFGYGTGTIVDTRGQDALVLTCGHIFRSSDGKGQISVEVFQTTPQGVAVAETLPGELIAFDDKRDVGLVSIRPTQRISVCRVAPQDELQQNARVWSVGCSRGANPTVDSTHVTGIQHDHVNAAHRPVEGRSGGGLFDAQGRLVGLCTGAYQDTDEGLYVSLGTIHAELDRLQLASVYSGRQDVGLVPPTAAPPATLTPPAQPPVGTLAPVPPEVFNSPVQSGQPNVLPVRNMVNVQGNIPMTPVTRGVASQSMPIGEVAALERIAGWAENNEVVVIVRPQTPGGRSEIMTLNNVSPQFVEQLQRMQQPGGGNRIASQP